MTETLQPPPDPITEKTNLELKTKFQIPKIKTKQKSSANLMCIKLNGIVFIQRILRLLCNFKSIPKTIRKSLFQKSILVK